jgi:chemotaxis signal transduction protein
MLPVGLETRETESPGARTQATFDHILDLRPISSLPYAPAEIAGLIDVRGRSVTVIDLRAKLGMAAAAATDATRIIILDANNNGTGAFGLIADRVHEVTDLDTESLEAAPELGSRWDSRYIEAIGRWRDGFVIVLDLEHFLHGDAAALAKDTAVGKAA